VGLRRQLAADLGGELEQARLERQPIEPITERHTGFGTAEAYQVQAATISRRLDAGECIIGGKLGFTSRAMQQAMGVDHPNYGWLTDAMLLHDGAIDLSLLIHPKVEPEIAFLLGADLEPPVSVRQVLEATRGVLPCLEVVDSRYVGFRFAAADNIADNSSAGVVALGDPVRPSDLDLTLLGVVVSENGRLRFTAAGAAALDHPAAAVAWMANHCTTSGLGRNLQKGDLVISGGLTPPIDLRPGTVVTAEFDRIGSITVHAA
jgi:2-keto-4-pentenoate hydratase